LAEARALLVWLPAIAQMAVIFVASSLPNLTALPGGISDKTGHFAGYALLSILVLYALASGRWAGVSRGAAAQAAVVSALYGLTDEFHQRFVAGRSAAWDDVAADAVGAVAGALIVIGARRLAGRFTRTRNV
jgi:VanZ family protein